MIPSTANCIAFCGSKRIASGPLSSVALKAKAIFDRDKWAQVVIFDDATSFSVEVDFRGTARDVLRRLAERDSAVAAPPANPQRGPGRPKLGVVAREVTLLPRHWDWLAAQPGGASVALRKLVEAARKQEGDAGRTRPAREAAYRFMSAIGGNLPGFEEASRALFAGDAAGFAAHTAAWPEDVRNHAGQLAAP